MSAASVAAVLALGACGGDDGSSTSTPAPDGSAATTAATEPAVITGITLTLTEPAALAGTYDSAAIATTDDIVCAPAGKGGFFVSFVAIGTAPADFPAGLQVVSAELLTLGMFAGPGTAQANLGLVSAAGERSSAAVEVEFTDALSGTFRSSDAGTVEGSWACRTG